MSLDHKRMLAPPNQLGAAVFRGQTEEVIRLCREFPELAEEGDNSKSAPNLQEAARQGHVSVVRALLDHGFNINVMRLPEKTTALVAAIREDQEEIVDLLLERGANVDIGRPLISALNQRKSAEMRLGLVKKLVAAGVNVNNLYPLYGDKTVLFSALDYTKDVDVVAFLKSRGAKNASEIQTS